MPPKASNWIDRVFPFYELIRIFNFYLDLECWIISPDRRLPWHPIRYHNRTSWPIEFDDLFGKREEREKFGRLQIEKALLEQKPICAVHNGLCGFFVPIIKKGKSIGVLQSGVFLRERPSRTGLLKQWKALAGVEPSGFNTDFSRYIRAILETPLLEGPAFKALEKLLCLYADVIAGETDWRAACRKAEELKNGVFSKLLPHRSWVETAVKNNLVYPPTWWIEKERTEKWRREEQGIDRAPTIVLAIKVDESGVLHQDDLDLMLRNYSVQKELFKFSRSLSNTVANPLEDDGMLFFTSAEPSRNDVQGKLEILDRIDLLSKFMEKKFHLKVLVGISRCFPPNENLSRVMQEAITALGFCQPLERPILFYEDVRNNPTIPSPPNFYHYSKNLIDVYSRGAVGEIEGVRQRYIQQILSHSAGRPENVRLHFLYAFGQILDLLKKRSPIQDKSFHELFNEFESRLHVASNIADLIEAFRGYLKKLLELNLKPAETSQAMRFEAIRKYVDENFNLDLKLEDVARDNGFSVSVFGRGFKRTVGLGFAAYLRKIRLQEAQKFLVSSRLPIAQISTECGFNNLQYFFDVFKRSTGRTPQEFRDLVRQPLSPKV